MRNPRIRTFYKPQMAINNHYEKNFSMSPAKPKIFMEHISKREKKDLFEIDEDFDPFSRDDFLVAHTIEYVNGFFKNISPYSSSSKLVWTPEFAESVKYTNSSLYNAIKFSILHPEIVTLSSTSGFHHATPYSGDAFCTFSGQVIASKKIYDEFGLSGAYLDLDAHYGNSIDDSMEFVEDLDKAIKMNINPMNYGIMYIEDLRNQLILLEEEILKGEIHYIVFAHGADSTIDDDLHGQLTDNEWIEVSDIVYNFIKDIDNKMNKPIPLTLTLFGGYRKNKYHEVLDLHLQDLIKCHEILCN